MKTHQRYTIADHGVRAQWLTPSFPVSIYCGVVWDRVLQPTYIIM